MGMKYYKLHFIGYIYFAVYHEDKPNLFYNTHNPKGWVWGAGESLKTHSERRRAQIVSELEVLVMCGRVPDNEAYTKEHFPKYYERYDS